MTDSKEISQKSVALSTELSQQSPPIPLTHNSSPLNAPPSPPSNIPPSINSALSRQIPKSITPSKRPIPERLVHRNRNNSYIANAFIPQDLAEFIATRERRERAWHARFITCTTVTSNLYSTLANFTEDIAIEEAVALKSYLRLNVSSFAAADSLPSPTCVPSQTRP